MKATKKKVTRQATEADFTRGTILINSSGCDVVLGDLYDEGCWNSHVYDGTRHVGAVVTFTGEARFYQIAV